MKTIRCSSLPIIAKCQAPFHATGALRVNHDGGIAAGGTAVHRVCETIALTGERPADMKLVAHGLGVDADFLGRATWYALSFWRDHGGLFPHAKTESEMAAELPGPHRITGHVDVMSLISADEGRIVDWKSGYRTDADVEPQMRGYAYLLGKTYNLKTVTATVVWLQDETYQQWEWSVEEMAQWAVEIGAKLDKWNGTYTIGDHCRYCPIFLTCPAQHQIVAATVDRLRLATEPTPAEIGMMYESVQSVERLCDSFREYARKAVQVGGPISVSDTHHLALVPSNRDKIDPLKAWPAMAAELTQEEIAPAVKLSKTALLAAVSDKAPRGQKGIAKTDFMGKLREAGAVETTKTETLRIVRKDADPKELE
jgi:hypothetical protein